VSLLSLFPDSSEGSTTETRNGLSQRPQPDQLYAGYKQWVCILWFMNSNIGGVRSASH